MEDANRQISQMVAFLTNEAKEKAEEIDSRALQEYNIEKLKLVQAQKEKIRAELAAKAKALEVKQAIAHSSAINGARLKKIDLRNEKLMALKVTVREELVAHVKSAAYKETLADLVLQGVWKVADELVVEVRTKKEHHDQADAVLASVEARFEKAAGRKIKLTVDKHNTLDAATIGGVVLAVLDGRITVDNTLDARVELEFTEDKPELRRRLFPSR